MIDMHCHILPGVDDGSKNMETSIGMAEDALRSGVTEIIATPHFNCDADDIGAELDRFERAYDRLTAALKEKNYPLLLHDGAEILCSPTTPELLRQGLLPTLAGSRYLLVEFMFDETPDFMDETLGAIAAEGAVPIVAHPERYDAVMNYPDLPLRWFHMGYLLQLNKGSVLGNFGPDVRMTAERLLGAGLAHTVASDAHGVKARTARLDRLRQILSENLDPAYVNILLRDNPSRIILDQTIIPIE